MLDFMRPRLPEISFLRKLSKLAGGALVGQFILIASSPLLTRLFTPEELGFFAIFSALAGMTGMVVGLRFEFAIPVMREDTDAAAMAVVTALAAAIMATAAALLVWLLGDLFVEAVGAPGLGLWLWLVPGAVLIWCLGTILSYWSVRRGTYGINGTNRVLLSGSQAGSQLVLGFLAAGGPGLILGYLVGYVVRLAYYLFCLPANERRLMTSRRWPELWHNARHNWRYPAFSFPSTLLQSACQHTPAILVAALYGPAVAGWYALSQRVVGLPVQMLSQTASQVFLGETRGLDRFELRRLFLRTIILFSGLGLAGTLPLLLFGPEILVVVFGDPWRETGILVQLLIPLYLARFIFQPVSQLLNILKRHEIHLIASILNATALVLSFGMGYALALDPHLTILLFSLLSAGSFLFSFVVSWRLLDRRVAVLPAPPRSTRLPT